MLRRYRLTLLDRDGESHSYPFRAPSVWPVLSYVTMKIQQGPNEFYGHTATDTIEVTAAEMLPTWDFDGLKPLTVR